LPETKAEGGSGKAEGDNLENVPPPSALPTSSFPRPPSTKSVPLCPLPEFFTVPPADSPPLAHNAAPPTAAPPSPNPESRVPSGCRNPKSPSVSQSIAALNRLDRQRRNDRRSNGDAPPPSTTGHPILDAILDEFRKTSPITAPQQHPTPDTS
ncbi:MAG: hypothetical protein WD229_10630, partial [Pirellulales bacterium]